MALGIHGLVLLPLLVSTPTPLPASSQAVMVGVTVNAPGVKTAAQAPTSAPATPMPTPHLPRTTVTHAPPSARSIDVTPEAAAESQVQTRTTATEATSSKASADNDNAIEAPRYQAAYLNNPQPPYPAMSRKQREEGTVRLHVMVGANGHAELVKVKVSSGHERLDMAARAAVQEWRFVPARQRGQNIAGWVEVPIKFQLEK